MREAASDSGVCPLETGGGGFLMELRRGEAARDDDTRGVTAERAVAPLAIGGGEGIEVDDRLEVEGVTRAVAMVGHKQWSSRQRKCLVSVVIGCAQGRE